MKTLSKREDVNWIEKYMKIPDELTMDWVLKRMSEPGPLSLAVALGFLTGERHWIVLGLLGGMFLNGEELLKLLRKQYQGGAG